MSRGPRVGVNASIVGSQPTGLGIYAIKLVGALDRLRDDLAVYSSNPEAFAGLRASTHAVSPRVRPERGISGHIGRFVWNQTLFRARAGRSRAILNTVPEGILGPAPPQITVVHDLLPIFFPQEYPRQQYYFRHFVPRVLAASRIVVAVSENTRRDVLRHYDVPADKIRVVLSGYDPRAYFQNGAGDAGAADTPYFLYVGNLLPHKNLLRLLDAFAILRRRRHARLLVRGEGRRAHAAALQERAETLGLGRAIEFLGYASETDLRGLFTGAAALVLPSLYEGFGLPVLEAMACGTPVITSTTGALVEVGGGATLTVDALDAVALADAMYRVLAERDFREELQRRGLARAAEFSWTRTARELSRLLDEACSGPAQTAGP